MQKRRINPISDEVREALVRRMTALTPISDIERITSQLVRGVITFPEYHEKVILLGEHFDTELAQSTINFPIRTDQDGNLI